MPVDGKGGCTDTSRHPITPGPSSVFACRISPTTLPGAAVAFLRTCAAPALTRRSPRNGAIWREPRSSPGCGLFLILGTVLADLANNRGARATSNAPGAAPSDASRWLTNLVCAIGSPALAPYRGPDPWQDARRSFPQPPGTGGGRMGRAGDIPLRRSRKAPAGAITRLKNELECLP